VATTRFTWRGYEFATTVAAPLVERRMRRASAEVVGDLRQRISTPYPPASRPGSPPHRRTGRLRASIESTLFRDLRAIVARFTATVRYAKFLQHGTRKMAARPFMHLDRRQLARFIRRVNR